MIVNIFLFIGVAVILFFINWRLAAMTLIPTPFLVWVIAEYTRRVRPAFRVAQSTLASLNAIVQDNLSGLREREQLWLSGWAGGS
jgi:ABC-type multidrug transport system fused ATPase/permease subunit